ncbi:NAD binding domain of 6-phosphogluconate dehydrogenase-domain-containing protein [Aspergillus bertholletiae]|uniref:NAD binding domain of 6-phosphogluconate dehydrogenase-domain-containing protein n=1 Tax=Aspergillus bertholletiae TaxID=1226010 RepID=A0A5N7AYA9_9EURO|nr:NAD binding domain of 6-phosphogluconate dehydrogenase-domain-containing protein [Aspergillus bertholletiae]
MASHKPQIGWYGIGSMGRPMAENLQRHLADNNERPLIYSNRTLRAGDTLESLGAIPTTDFTDLVRRCDIVFTMIPNDDVLQRLMKLAIASSSDLSNKIFVDCSTVHPDTIKKLSSDLDKHEAALLSAPVFGGPSVAATGSLVFAISGLKSACLIVEKYIVNVMGRKLIHCGENASNASLLKIGGNIVTLSLMEAVGEAQVFAEKTGLGTEAMEQLITESFGAVAGGYSQRLTSGIYAPPLDTRPGFGISLAIKDAKHALSMAEEHGFQLPGLGLVDKHMQSARDYGGECLDSSAMYGILRQQASLSFWNKTSRQSGALVTPHDTKDLGDTV